MITKYFQSIETINLKHKRRLFKTKQPANLCAKNQKENFQLSQKEIIEKK